MRKTIYRDAKAKRWQCDTWSFATPLGRDGRAKWEERNPKYVHLIATRWLSDSCKNYQEWRIYERMYLRWRTNVKLRKGLLAFFPGASLIGNDWRRVPLLFVLASNGVARICPKSRYCPTKKPNDRLTDTKFQTNHALSDFFFITLQWWMQYRPYKPYNNNACCSSWSIRWRT